ncbi:MAG TPA: hypothetical protein VF902_00210 [Coriobacteriia bacterium]
MDPHELFTLALALGLAPVVFFLARGLRFHAAHVPFAVMYGAVVVAYLAGVFEAVVAPGLLDLVQHVAQLLAAAAFLLGVRAVRVEVQRGSRPTK